MDFFSKNAIRRVVLFLLVNTLIGLIVSGFNYGGRSYSYVNTLRRYEMLTHIAALSAGVVWIFLSWAIPFKKWFVKFPLMYCASIGAALGGLYIGIAIDEYVSGFDLTKTLYFSSRILAPTVIITILYISAALMLRHVMEQVGFVDPKPIVLEKSSESEIHNNDDSLPIRIGEYWHQIKFNDIIFLTSDGRNCVVHTCDADHHIHKKLGDMEDILSSGSFIRIHKRFIVNKKYVGKLQYYQGGRYNLYLNDEDESILPVGRLYGQTVKKVFTL